MPAFSCEDNCIYPKGHRFKNILWFCLVSNFIMFLLQLYTSYVAYSVSLLANSLDFLSDAVNYGISLFVLQRSIRIKAIASIFKGFSLGAMGLWAAFEVIHHSIGQQLPNSYLMSIISFIALLVNIICAFLLYKFRENDSNSQSVWICSRNDAIGNIAVMLAAAGIYETKTIWPDIIIASLLIYLSVSGALQILRVALREIN